MGKYFRNFFCFSLLFIILIFPSWVRADVCQEAELSRLKVLSNNISVHDEFLDKDDESLDWGGSVPYGSDYLITISGMSDGIYAVSVGDVTKEFRGNDIHDGSILYYVSNSSGKLSIRFYPTNCDSSLALRTVEVALPIFNEFYYTSECDRIREENIDLDVCHKTVLQKIDSDYFYQVMDKYLKSDEAENSIFSEVLSYFENPYVLVSAIVLGIILFVIIILLVRRFIERRRLD